MFIIILLFSFVFFFFFNDTATTEIYTLSLHDALPVGHADLGVTSWHGDQWQHGGASAWGWITYDPELNLIYYGTSNPGAWNPNQRPGDNKWSTSIFARDPNTGLAKWVYQLTPHDEWDYDAVNESILADLNIGGQPHKAL